jgi:hypothetical protein
MAKQLPTGDEFQRIKAEMAEIARLQKIATDGVGGYYKILKDVHQVNKDISHVKKQISEAEELANQYNREAAKLLRGKNKQERADIILKNEQYKVLKKQAKEQKVVGKILKEQLKTHENNTQQLKNQLTLSNAIDAGLKSTVNTGIKLAKNTYQQMKSMTGQLKAVRGTELSMGILNKQADAFRLNIYRSAMDTNIMGAGVEDLSKMQDVYSQTVGRTVILNQANLNAVAEIAKGTILGSERAAEFAGNMDLIGYSVDRTRDVLEDVANTSNKMGVNTGKVIDKIDKNFKMMQRFRFKNGVEGFKKMALYSTRFRMDMEAISGFAEGMFNVEGAVDMAAGLQVMGGEWSKLADPLKLMYMARNDMDGLFQSVVTATKGMATFNKETGQMEMTGMQMHRLREIAKQTGIEYEQLSNAALEFNKAELVKGKVRGMFDNETKNLISSLATFDKNSGQWMIQLDPKTNVSVDKLNSSQKEAIKALADQKESLKERALQATTFDDKFKNIINSLKMSLLPVLEGVDKVLSPMFDKMAKNFSGKDGLYNTLFQTGEKIGEWIGSFKDTFLKVGDWLSGGGLKTVVDIITSPMTWMGVGGLMAAGFMASSAITRGLFGGLTNIFSGKGMGKMMGKTYGALGGKMYTKSGSFMKGGEAFNKAGEKVTNKGAAAMIKSNAKIPGMGRMAAGAGLGVAGMGLDYGRGMLKDPDSGVGKAMGVGASALKYAGMGAMLGPWGALAGLAIGGGMGIYDEWFGKKKQVGDFIMQPGKTPTAFDKNDTIIGAKPNGPIEKVLSEEVAGTKSKFSDKLSISFAPLTINGSIKVDSPSGSSEIDVNSPIFLRELSNLIQIELRKAINGGKLNPNPI